VEKALQAARELRDALQTEHFCITLGAKGVLALAASGEHRQFPARAREVYDVTGAGDTFISVLGALLIAGVDFFEAVDMANLGAGIVVGKVGTATVTPSEMLGFAAGERKLFTLEEIGPLAESLRGQGRRVVFTNGCFDLLHAGHIQYLEASRAQGDALVVGINSDASVKRLKGEGRPLIGEEDRAHLLAALSCVDYVVVFEEDTPESLLRAVRPAVLTKGADYTVETVVGHDLVPQWGGEVVLIPLKENRSTSGLIDRIRAGQG
jgi:D-beta-D-heptose 7-phosphate kinase/D-beta-D-heptose 1-phosphate adenosyltransferase